MGLVVNIAHFKINPKITFLFIRFYSKTTLCFGIIMKRRELTYLSEWATSPTRKPLIIRGARQVGKSTLVHLFANEAGFDLLELNFEKAPRLAELFVSNQPQEIIQLIYLQLNQKIIPGKTLLFLDEIQAASQVLATLRYFYEDMPQLHVLAAGSLLEFTLANMPFSMPVGRIEYMHLGPLSFEDFLAALGENGLLDFLKNYTLIQEYPPVIHEKLMKLLKAFLIVGGMPQAVAHYLEHRDFIAAEKVKHSILDTYVDDFAKYAKRTAETRLRLVFTRLSTQIGKKFKYSNISPHDKSTTIAAALTQLTYAKIAYPVYHSACNGIPLGAEINAKVFKVLFLDVGLCATQLGLSYLDVLHQEEIDLRNSGAVSEQLIGQHLLYLRPTYETPELYYWVREKKSAESEIDYVVSNRQQLIPVEVKAGKTGTLKSLHYFMHEKKLGLAIRFNSQQPLLSKISYSLPHANEQVRYHLLSLPLYMVGQMYRLIENVPPID